MAQEEDDDVGEGEESSDLEIQDDMFLTFRIADESYAITIYTVSEIIRMVKITPIPEVYDFMKGVINLRGKVIPVMDIRLRMGFKEKEYGDRTCVVVVNVKGLDLGIIVDSVTEVLNIPRSNIDPAPNIRMAEVDGNPEYKKQKYVSGIGKMDDGIKIIIDLEKLVFDYDAGKFQEMIKEVKETKEAKEAKEIKGIKVGKTKEIKEVNVIEEPKESKESKVA
ncbi:MAG: purine-binding chemotaxis protein CheW [Oligoflexia bacterium]|nr:purine-binding chemotaxis protein CheW [Oligoflexia bacterium]